MQKVTWASGWKFEFDEALLWNEAGFEEAKPIFLFKTCLNACDEMIFENMFIYFFVPQL
jgi:hypothetical protein